MNKDEDKNEEKDENEDKDENEVKKNYNIYLQKEFNNFNKEKHFISEKQLNYLNKILTENEVETIKKDYNILEIKDLKCDKVYNIIQNYAFLTGEEKIILKLYFKKELNNTIKQNFTNLIVPDNEKNNILNLLKKKDLNNLINLYPNLNYLINKNHKKFKSVDIPLNSNSLYEYGYQIKESNQKFYYLRFYDWASYDIDNINFETINKRLLEITESLKLYIFALYQTTNGFHIHIMNKKIEYNSIEFKFLSKILNNDIFYFLFTLNNGYKLRLSKKKDEILISKFVKYYYPKNNDIKICSECYHYEKIYNNYLNIMKD